LLEGKPVDPETLISHDELAELSLNLTRLLQKLQAQAAQREDREARYRQAFEANLVGTFFWDAAGRLTEANAAFERVTGFSRGEVAAGKVSWATMLPSAPEEPHGSIWTELEGSAQHTPFELELVRKDGSRTTVWCAVLALPTGPMRGIGFLWDLSDRESVEAADRSVARRLRSVWERSVDGMMLTDQYGHVLAVNQSYCNLHETSPLEAVGRLFTEAYAADSDRARLLEEYQRRFQKTPIDSHAELQVTLRSGRKLDLEFVHSLIELRHGNPLYLSIVRDVTARRQAERALIRQREEQLEMERRLRETQRLESLGVMAGGIAHDFNNLLTAIMGNASLAMMQLAESSPLFTYLRNIEKSSMQAADLCKQMLAYSGRGRFVLQRVSLNSLIQDIAHLLQVSVAKGVRLNFEFADNPPLVDADPAQVQQVVLNLVTNASEATGDAGGVVTIRTGSLHADRAYLATTHLSPEVPEGEYVFFEVIDAGCGMSPDTQARIFDPFFTTKFTGRGLGLAAVWGIVRGHKGALKLQSEPGRGSVFRVLLPRSKPLAKEALAQEGPSFWRGSGTILLVDDDESVRSVTARMLESFGFTVLTASDRQQGLDTYARYHKDITAVLLDLSMPGMSAEEAYAHIRRIRPDARVVLISGHDEQQAVLRFAAKGLVGFIQKPFKAQELNAKLQAIFTANAVSTHSPIDQPAHNTEDHKAVGPGSPSEPLPPDCQPTSD
jgi:PAS domain S-box-containing protein